MNNEKNQISKKNFLDIWLNKPLEDFRDQKKTLVETKIIIAHTFVDMDEDGRKELSDKLKQWEKEFRSSAQ